MISEILFWVDLSIRKQLKKNKNKFFAIVKIYIFELQLGIKTSFREKKGKNHQNPPESSSFYSKLEHYTCQIDYF